MLKSKMKDKIGRNAGDELSDVMTFFPNAMQKFDKLKNMDMSDITVADIVRAHRSHSDLMHELSSWRSTANIRSEFSYRSSEILDSEIDQRLLSLVPRIRYYPQILDARTIMTYLTAQILQHLELFQLCNFTAQWRAQRSSTAQELPDFPYLSEYMRNPFRAMEAARWYCDAVVESMEQHLLPSSGVIASSAIVFPILTAMGFLAAQGDPRVEYLLTLAQRFQEQSGYPLANTITGGRVSHPPAKPEVVKQEGE